MLAWQFCDFSGDPDQYNAKKPYIFVIFQGGGGGGGVLNPCSPSGSAHDWQVYRRYFHTIQMHIRYVAIHLMNSGYKYSRGIALDICGQKLS